MDGKWQMHMEQICSKFVVNHNKKSLKPLILLAFFTQSFHRREFSELYRNKGTNRYYRVYAQVQKASKKESKSLIILYCLA